MKTKIFDLFKHFDKKKASIIIPGGSSLRILEELPIHELDTSKWTIYFSDERCNKDNLNYNDASKFLSLLKGSIVHPIKVIEDDYDKSAHLYNLRLLNDTMNKKIDLAFFGVGENGHTCSIWPNSLAIHSTDYAVYARVNNEFPHRITITPKFINEQIEDRFYFLIPLKDGKAKSIKAPDDSIIDELNSEFKIYKATS